MADTLSAGQTASSPSARRRARSIALYLFVLALVALVPAFIFSAVLLQRNNEAQERVVETLVVGTSRSIVEAVDREIDANIATLRVLGTVPALLDGDFQSFHARVTLALDGTGSYVYLLDRDLMSVLSTRVAYGGPSRPTADPESSRRALASGEVVISDTLYGPISERWVFNILLPLVLRNGAPMVLGLNRNAEDLSAALLANKLPDGWNVALIDKKNTVVAASPGTAAPGDPFTLADTTSVATSRGWVSVQSDDTDYLAVVQRSPLTGWTLFAWAPRDLIAQPLATAFWSLLVGGMLLAAVVVLIIYWVSLQIGRSVHGLEDDAKRLGAGEAVPARDYPISEIAAISERISEASRSRRSAETEVRLLMRELAHRSKNQMTVIAAMAKQSAKGATSVPEFVADLEKRIFGLSRSTDLLLSRGISRVELEDLLTQQVDPLCPIDSGRVTLEGPSVIIDSQSAQLLGMAAHELATNAVKYGAFASKSGRIEISWSFAGDVLRLHWRERGAAPPPVQPARRGYGTTVLEGMVGRHLGAVVERIVHSDGIEWTFSIPAASLALAPDAGEAAARAAMGAGEN
jgi:two-component sensor histidine kinase